MKRVSMGAVAHSCRWLGALAVVLACSACSFHHHGPKGSSEAGQGSLKPKFARGPQKCDEVDLETAFKQIAGPLYRPPGEYLPPGDASQLESPRHQSSNGGGGGKGVGCLISFADGDRSSRTLGGPHERELSILYYWSSDDDSAKTVLHSLFGGTSVGQSGQVLGDETTFKNLDPSARCRPAWEVEVRDGNLVVAASVRGEDYIHDAWVSDPAYAGKTRRNSGDQDDSDIACGDGSVSDQIKSSAFDLARAAVEGADKAPGLKSK